MVKVLITAGANVDKEDNDGKPPLYRASEKGHVEVVKELVAAGANVGKSVRYFDELAISRTHTITSKEKRIIKILSGFIEAEVGAKASSGAVDNADSDGWMDVPPPAYDDFDDVDHASTDLKNPIHIT